MGVCVCVCGYFWVSGGSGTKRNDVERVGMCDCLVLRKSHNDVNM